MSKKLYKLDSKRSVNHNKLVSIISEKFGFATCKVVSTGKNIYVKVSNLKPV